MFPMVFYQVNAVINKTTLQILFVNRLKPPFGLVRLAYQKGLIFFSETDTPRPKPIFQNRSEA